MPGNGETTERRPRILHLTADYPDPIAPEKTPVIDRLIGLAENRYEHQVLSLNRRNPGLWQTALLAAGQMVPPDERSLRPCKRGVCLEYLAPPKGILHLAMLRRLAAWIVARLEAQGERPDLVMGHKLTIEGLVAHEVARRLSVPYALTLQGNTDQKIIAFRPDLKRRFAAAYHDAACVFAFAPWARNAVDLRLGARAGLTLDLPCPTLDDTVHAPAPGGNALIGVFHLRNHRTKNLSGLARAVRLLEGEGQPCRIEIFGGGSAQDLADCAAIADTTAGLALMGPRKPEQLRPIMNGAIAMVMPSRRESFGLVFVEALFAGLPIIYPKGAGVDGYFDGLPFAIGVDARDDRAIASAIRMALADEGALKQALEDWQRAGGLQRFSRAAIAAQFAHGLDTALALNGLHSCRGAAS